MLSIKIINRIQRCCIHLFQIVHVINYYISQPKVFIFSKTSNLEFSYIEVWFTDENSKTLEVEITIYIALV